MFASLNITTKTKAGELITFLEFYCMCITNVSGTLKGLLSGSSFENKHIWEQILYWNPILNLCLNTKSSKL